MGASRRYDWQWLICFLENIPADAAVFKALNIEWLETYFGSEEIDERVLSHPDTEILAPGSISLW